MRLTVLACWGVMAVVLVAVEAKPYNPHVFDIASAYEAYHQLWMSEARRNAVAPTSFSQQVARTWPNSRSSFRRPAAPVAERPPQEPLAAGSETKATVVDQKTEEPVATEPTDTQTTTEVPVAETTTEVQAQEQATTEATMVQEEPTTEAQPQEQTTQQENEVQTNIKKASPQQTAANTKAVNKQETTPRQQSVSPPRRTPTQMQTAFDNFFNIWNAERLRNSIPPVATPIPPLSRPFNTRRRMKMRKQQAASKPVDPQTEAPAKKPVTEEPVDTLTQKAPSQEPTAAPAADKPAPGALDLSSLVNSANWGKQGGGAPLIIILQQPGAATPVLG